MTVMVPKTTTKSQLRKTVVVTMVTRNLMVMMVTRNLTKRKKGNYNSFSYFLDPKSQDHNDRAKNLNAIQKPRAMWLWMRR